MVVVWSEEPRQRRQTAIADDLLDTEDNFYDLLRFVSRHFLGFGKYNSPAKEASQLVVKLKWEDFKLTTSHMNVFQERSADLRQCGLIYAIKLRYSWTLIWVKIHNSKFVEITQIDSKPREIAQLTERQLAEIKQHICVMLDIPGLDQLVYTFRYWMPVMEDENLSNDNLLVINLQQLLSGYQWHGFELKPENIEYEYQSLVNGLTELKRAYHKHLVEGSPEPVEVVEVAEKTPEPTKRGASEDTPLRKRTRRGGEDDNHHHPHPKPKVVKEKVVDTSGHDNQPCYVTVDNLETIKQQIKYDPKKLKDMVKEFQTKYEDIQARFYSRWAKQSGSDVEEEEEDETSFSMYGPTQAEYEILISQEVVATKTLLKKLSHMDIFPNQQQMRAISNARRWINQRFKFDPATKTVQYLRDSNVVIPDYLDIPYIVIATHLHFDCLAPLLTYNHVRRNWYISKKTVDYIIAQCEFCNQ
ncbi:hypothetical protein OGAPHI_001500 [Ogataea philodendri]|uniref:Uncharacterized protein n=1 Tax=Ogataea philodendri TaxID=1378263 RepID=A0A9P8T8C4_9ASCO|nr:uncharacterized protein OGAPHI_001500 [Ogataea philodendri]KAH3669379.1 hypothetical protein OGAPHI_001500 [Ogataea philodendri]